MRGYGVTRCPKCFFLKKKHLQQDLHHSKRWFCMGSSLSPPAKIYHVWGSNLRRMSTHGTIPVYSSQDSFSGHLSFPHLFWGKESVSGMSVWLLLGQMFLLSWALSKRDLLVADATRVFRWHRICCTTERKLNWCSSETVHHSQKVFWSRKSVSTKCQIWMHMKVGARNIWQKLCRKRQRNLKLMPWSRSCSVFGMFHVCFSFLWNTASQLNNLKQHYHLHMR